MKKIFILTLLSILVYACGKEKSVDTTDPNSGGGNTNSSVLVKTAIKVGGDSAVNTYGYDNQKRFASQQFSGTINVMEDYGQLRVTRNAQGAIERILTVEDGSGDQTEYRVYYDANAKRYLSKTSSATFQGMTIKDSTVYSYNAAGQIAQELYYINEGSGYMDFAKTEYTYASGNLTNAKYYYRNASNTYQQSALIAYEYDSKTAALNLGAEAILLEQVTFVSANNITKLSFTDLEDPTENEVVTFAYTYNSANRPTAASIIIQSVGVPIPMTYFYN